MRLSIDSLQHLQVYFQVLVPVPVACRRLLRGADCSACADNRSGPRVADLRRDASKKIEGLAQRKTRWSSD